MRSIKICLFTLLVLISINFSKVSADSAFFLESKEHILLAHNFDLNVSLGYWIENPRQVQKTSLTINEKPFKWTSSFGSLTFNILGKDFPQSGINEAGLVVASLPMDGTIYPKFDNRQAIMSNQWVQYQLDNSSTVRQVLDSDKKIRIAPYGLRLHFLVCDKERKAVIIQILNGVMNSFAIDNERDCPVITDIGYSESVRSIRYYKDFGGGRKLPDGKDSFGRFAKASRYVKSIYQTPIEKRPDLMKHSFTALKSLSLSATRLSAVYDSFNLKVYYKTASNQQPKVLNLNDFKFDCSKASLVVEKDALLQSPTSFQEFSVKLNTELILNAFFENGFIRQVLGRYKQAFIDYSSTVECSFN